MTAAVVANGPVRISTTDRGGDGPDLVLMHGLGDSQRAMTKVAELLVGWRVITLDLRGHGESTTAPWDFPKVIEDLDAVVAHYALEKPYVGGHSLGGMVALQYALAGRPVAGVINIDGWGPGIPERYLGQDPALVAERLRAIAAGQLPSRLARLVAGRSRQAREGTTAEVLALLGGADVVAWHREAPCPSLAFNAVASSSRLVALLMGREMTRLGESHRQGLRRDLAVLARERPQVSVEEVDATHGLIRTDPERVAAGICAFQAALRT